MDAAIAFDETTVPANSGLQLTWRLMALAPRS